MQKKHNPTTKTRFRCSQRGVATVENTQHTTTYTVFRKGTIANTTKIQDAVYFELGVDVGDALPYNLRLFVFTSKTLFAFAKTNPQSHFTPLIKMEIYVLLSLGCVGKKFLPLFYFRKCTYRHVFFTEPCTHEPLLLQARHLRTSLAG